MHASYVQRDRIHDKTSIVCVLSKLPCLVQAPEFAHSDFPEYAADKPMRTAMIPDFFRPFVQALYENRSYRFWACQVAGWGGYSLATFFSITLIDGDFDWPHLGHILLSALLGVLTTWPLRSLYQRTFKLSIWRRLLVASVAVAVLSGVWNVARVWVFCKRIVCLPSG